MARKRVGSDWVTIASAALVTVTLCSGCDPAHESGVGVRPIGDDDSPRLSGDFVHKFGLHLWETNSPLELRHTFVLTNVSDETLELVKVATSCACVVAEPDERSILPDSSLSLDATLVLGSPGTLTQHIQLIFGDGWRQELTLVGSARKSGGLQFAQGAADLTGGQDSVIDIILITRGEEGSAPPAPALQAPDTVDVQFTSWTPAIWLPDGHPERYRRWTGRVRVSPAEDWVADRESILLARHRELQTRLALDGMPTFTK